MELARVFLLGALFLIAFMLWNAWQNEYPNTQALKAPTPVVEKHVAAEMRKLPDAQVDEGQTTGQGQRFIHVKTDALDVVIDTQGGNIVQANLLNYPEHANEANSQPFQLLSNNPDSYYVAQSGIAGSDKPTLQYKSAQINYNLSADQSELDVNLLCTSCGNVAIQKQFVFKRGDYLVPINYQINNHSNTLWKGQLYTQFQQKKRVPAHSLFNISSYIGGAISTQEKPYQKVSFDKMGDGISMATENGWVAMLQHYFISAWVPPAGLYHFYSYGKDNNYTLGMLGNPFQVEPGAQYTAQAKLYLGPESMDRLKAVAPHLDLTVDYGILWFISMALFWLLKHIHRVVGNWGWSIVIVTVLIKLAFYHLSAKSYRSMAAMRNLQPRLNALKERYADDRQKLTQATMELYKAEKVNPLGGCLPILVQIPVFIALYWMLLESVELRQAPFILWIHDLSTKDPYYILPILMGITMFVQQRLNPPPPDPTQAKVMQFLPILFTALFLNFPAGLVLYWVVNNTLSILQQWYITRRMELQFNQKNLKKR
ncbi:membrane protein insertase YidC [Rickettsiella endosymbiont of Dermanyssus gallinae]|uniref:membrane protein insertase YidC n=1 Tax=Rickettsiella endosymbiont of Dermanyssus gallinae TaxID=2856608 RepID=UPI001C532025|nr:membrane protein insertase YidC [Rickettsiella endosymbiont of Dermanyssus gallinae]